MNRSLASWLAGNPGGAVLVTGLLGLLPLFGLGFAFFLPGAVPALVVLVRGARLGIDRRARRTRAADAGDVDVRAAGAGGLDLLCVGAGSAAGAGGGARRGRDRCRCACRWRRSPAPCCWWSCTCRSATRQQFWAPFVRDLAQEMKRRGLPMDLEKDGLAETLARTLWGWITALTMLLAMCALFLARWWQSLCRRARAVRAEFQQTAARRGAGDGAARAHRRVAAHGAGAGGRHGAAVSGRAGAGGAGGGAPVQGRGPADGAWLWAIYVAAGARRADHGRRAGGLGIRGQLAALATAGAELLETL